MTLTIRSARPDDEAAVLALWTAADLIASYNDPATDFRLARAKAGSDILVAVDGRDRITGSVMVGHDGHRGWLYYLASDPAHRGEGIGRRLIEAAQDYLRAAGIKKVQLMIRETNERVRGFYEHLGFEHTPRIVMAKWLDD
jgi:ribosomal protein S18 acetylase RimI-like enzyme